MNIQIRSQIQFDEPVFDKAYGFAKRLIASGDKIAVKRIGGVAFTGSSRSGSIVVNIKRVGNER